jgi:cytochrome c oxidase subunit 3
MTQPAPTSTARSVSAPEGLQSLVADFSSDQQAFKNVPWGKVMMWIFLLGDTFIFGSFLIGYMNVRMSTQVAWPHPAEVFALTVGGKQIPLLLVVIMTFILTSSCGTMSLAINYGFKKDRKRTFQLLLLTALLGASFVGMQAIEWTKLIHEGVRPWANPMGAAQFGASFFMITGFHGTHVTIGVIFLIITAIKVLRGDLDNMRPGFLTGRKGNYEIVEILGLYWHFVDLVWVFIFAVFYLW